MMKSSAIALIAFLSLLPTISFSQSAELNALYQNKVTALSQGDFDNAVSWGIQAMNKAHEEFGDNETYANYASDLGQLYMQLKHYDESLLIFEKIVLIYQQRLGADHVYTAVTHNNLGNLYRFTGKDEKALRSYKQALEAYAKALGPKHEYYRMTLTSLIDLCQKAPFPNELETIYRDQRSLAASPAAASKEYVAWTNNLAMVLEQNKKYEEAEKLYLECIGIAEKNRSEYATDYPTLNANLGQFYLSQGKLDEAERYMLKSLDPGSESYATHVNNLAMVLEKKNQHTKALANYETALQHLEKMQQDTGSIYRMITYNLSSSYAKAGRYKDEIALLRHTMTKLASRDARLMNELAIAYERHAEYRRADSLYDIVINKMNTVSGLTPHETTRAVAGRADVWRIQGKLKEAEKLLAGTIQALLKDSVSNRESLVTLNHNLAYLYKTMGQLTKAEQLGEKAIRQHIAIHGKDVEYANMVKNQGSLYMDLVQYEKAESLMKDAMNIERREIGTKHEAFGTTLNQLGLIYFYEGRYSESKSCIEESLKIKEATLGKTHEHYANSLVNLANVYIEEGLPEKADPLYKQAEKIYRNTSGTETRNYANVLHVQSKVKASLGLFVDAKLLLVKSLDIQQRVLGVDHPDYANTLNSLGMLYSSMALIDKADSAYSVSLQIRKKNGGTQSYAYAQSLNNIAELYMFNGRAAEAESMYLECLSVAEKIVGKQHPDYASYQNNLGQAQFKLKKFKEAANSLQQAIALRESIFGKNHLLTLEARSNLLVALEASGRPKDAEKIFLDLNDQYLDFIFKKFPHLTDKEKASFYNTIKYHFESFQSFALRRLKDNPAISGSLFDIQLATKAVLLNASKKAKQLILQSSDNQLKTLYNDWLSRREYLARIYSLSESEIASRHINVKALENHADSIERKLGTSFPAFENAYRPSRISWKDIRKNLKPGEAAIEMTRFYVFDNAWIDSVQYAAFIVKNSSTFPEVVILPDGKTMETRFLKYYRATMRSRIDDKRSWDNFWSPIQSQLKGINTLYFSPDGVYNEINLNTLTDSTGAALLDKLTVHLVTSTKEIVPQTSRSKFKKVVLLGRPSYRTNFPDGKSETGASRSTRWLGETSFADLPGTQKEVEEIASLLKPSSQVEVYTGDQAREEIIKKTTDANILHVATHGFFIPTETDEFEAYSKKQDNAADPMLRSGIVLAGVENFQRNGATENAEDGILTAMEISNLQLDNTELVVMSACETGLGEVRYGEGVFGLQRAFRIAGSKAMIMSLWKVDDQATQEMMVNFYSNWLKTSDKRKSFELAQQSIRKKYTAPYYWGAFVLLGE